MKRPYLTPISRSEQVINAFGGYCHKAIVPSNQFYDMENMTADEYPVLAPRKQRGIPESDMETVPEALHGGDVLWSLRTNTGGATRLYRGDKVIDNQGTVGGTPFELKPLARKVYGSYELLDGVVCVPGDIDGDGYVTAADASLAMSMATGKINRADTAEEWQRMVAVGDLNGNGRVDAEDALNILLLSTQKITSAPSLKDGDRIELIVKDFPTNMEMEAKVTYAGVTYAAKAKNGDALTYNDIKEKVLFKVDGDSLVRIDNRGVLPRSIVSMGGYIVIFPDKVAYNTIFSDPNATEAQKEGQDAWIELENTSGVVASTDVKVIPCRLADKDFEDIVITRAVTVPTSPKNGDYWYDTGNKVLKQYSETDEQWVSVATVYTRIEATGIGIGFKEYDGVTLRMTNADGNAVYEELTSDTILWGVGDDYIVVTGIVESEVAEGAKIDVVLQRKLPDMDYVVEYGNRLWGCSSDNHEIYCSKLGDPTNWNCFMGVSTDSYAATIGTAGDFTGAAAVGGYVLFFKEHTIHSVYGTKPANFQIGTIHAPGIQDGCAASAVVVDEVLYYKGVQGIYATKGTMPTFLSEDLGNDLYFDAVGGRFGRRYVVSMKDVDDGWHLFVYDPKVGTWHRQDDTRMLATASIAEEMYYSERCGDNGMQSRIVSMGGGLGYAPRTEATENAATEEPVKWMVQTGYIESSTPEHLTVAQIRLRMKIDTGSMVRIRMRYDDDWEWQDVWASGRKPRRVISLPLIPRRCGKMQMQIEGVGDCQVYAITMIMEQGSEVDGGL